MKQSARLGELVLRLRINEDFKEFWELVQQHRDGLVKDAIHNSQGDPAEKRGAAREFDLFVNNVESSPAKAKQLKTIGS